MKSMPAEQLAAMGRMAGAPGMDPASLAQMQQSMANMSPEQMESVMRMSAGVGANPGRLGDPATMAQMAEVSSCWTSSSCSRKGRGKCRSRVVVVAERKQKGVQGCLCWASSSALVHHHHTTALCSSDKLCLELRLCCLSPSSVCMCCWRWWCFNQVMRDPNMMKSAAEMMRSLPPEQLKAMMAQAGPHLPPGADLNPELFAQMAEQVSKMPPEELAAMASAASSQAAAAAATTTTSSSQSTAAAASAPSSSGRQVVAPAGSHPAAASAPPGMPDMSAMATPEMMQMAMQMIQNMSPEDMAAMTEMMANGGPGAGGGLCSC